MALLAYQPIPIQGLNPTYVAAAAGGDTVPMNTRGFLHVKNGSGAAVTVTVVIPGNSYGQPIPDVPVAIAAGGAQFIGPFSSDMVNATLTGVDVTYSASASVTVAAVTI